MPSLLKTVVNRFVVWKDELAKSLQDPAADRQAAIRDSEQRLAQVREKLMELATLNTRLESQIKDGQNEVDKFNTLAERAAKAGDEPAVREALIIKQKAAKHLVELKEELVENRKVQGALEESLNQAEDMVRESKEDTQILEAKLTNAKLRQELARYASDLQSTGSPLAELKDLHETVEQESAKASALEEYAHKTKGPEAELLKKYDMTDSDASVEAELQAMMGKGKK